MLIEQVSILIVNCMDFHHNILQQEERLCGASLLILANKQDLPSGAKSEEIKEVLCLVFNVNISINH